LANGLSGLIHRHSKGNAIFMVAALAHLTKRVLISRRNGSWHVCSPFEEIDFEVLVLESLREMIDRGIGPSSGCNYPW
jgi:hypothetical protein